MHEQREAGEHEQHIHRPRGAGATCPLWTSALWQAIPAPPMTPQVRSFIEKNKIYKASVQELGTMLPAEDAELDAWIAAAIADSIPIDCLFLMLAAQCSGRPVDARHLVRGLSLIQHPLLTGGMVWMTHGDVAGAVARALLESTIHPSVQVILLLTAAAWCKEKGDGQIPPALRTAARRIARLPAVPAETIVILLAAAQLMEDKDVLSLVLDPGGMPADLKQKTLESSARVGEAQLTLYRRGPEPCLDAKPTPVHSSGGAPMRHSPTLGGKTPCPCGSGKKYKHCCLVKDREQRQAAGSGWVAQIESAEARLNAKALALLTSAQLPHLDPSRLRPELLPEYFRRLRQCQLWDTALSAFTKLGYRPELADSWSHMLGNVSRAGQRDTAEKLIALRAAYEEVPEADLFTTTRLLFVKGDPAAYLKVMEALARETLERRDDIATYDLALGILNSECPALGIFVARSCIPLQPRDDAHAIFDEVLRVRDVLQLPPGDEYADIIEKHFAEDVPDHGKDATVLRETRRRLEAKAGEVRQLKSRLDHLHHEVGRLESARHTAATARPAAPVRPAAAPADENTLRELRRKVDTLKAEHNARNEERTALRRELTKAQEELEKSRTASAATPAESDTAEDAHLLPSETLAAQPLRLPEYPRRFYETLHFLPPATARHALTVIARLASGEADAFAGVVRLKALPEVLRLRIGKDYRLLFRLHHERLEVVDLINRRDLEKRIRSLEATG